MNNKDKFNFILDEEQIEYLMEKTLKRHLILTFNAKEKITNEFMDNLYEFKGICPSCNEKLNLIGECNYCD